MHGSTGPERPALLAVLFGGAFSRRRRSSRWVAAFGVSFSPRQWVALKCPTATLALMVPMKEHPTASLAPMKEHPTASLSLTVPMKEHPTASLVPMKEHPTASLAPMKEHPTAS